MRMKGFWRRMTVGLVGLAAVAAAPPAVAQRVLDASQATRRVNGVASGTLGVTAGQGDWAWQSAVGTESRAESDYLYFDLAAVPVTADEGSISLTLRRGERRESEALFVFVRENWEPLWGIDVGWKSPVALRDVASPIVFSMARLPRDPERGERISVCFAWQDGQHELWVNGARVELELGTDDAGPRWREALGQARYLVVGAETDQTLPTGAWSQMRSELLSFEVFDTFGGWRGAAAVDGVASEKAVYGSGQEVIVILRGTRDGGASFSLEGIASDVAMAEVDDGVYVGRIVVPAGLNLARAGLIGTLTDPATKEVSTKAGPPIAIDSISPDAVGNILASVPWGGEIEVAWDASASADVDQYAVYRGVGSDPTVSGEPFAMAREPKLLDTALIPGLVYRYVVVPVDQAGNVGPASAVAAATAVGGTGPALAFVGADPADRTIRPGVVVTLTVIGQTGAQVTADLGELAQGVPLAEEGRTGRYVGTYTVKDTDVQATKRLHRVVAHLTDAFGQSDRAGPEVAVVGLDGLNDATPPTVAKVSHDGFQAAGFSGKLVAGDVVTVDLEGEPAGYASFELSEVAGRVAMKETSPGVYAGSFAVPWGATGAGVPLTVYLSDDGGNETAVVAERTLDFDTRVRLQVEAADALLPADRRSRTRLTTRAVDANGDKVQGHELVLTLSTTEEYTGVVGGGDIEGRRATLEDVDDVEVKWGGVTDAFGEVGATYTAGFAAKTALVVAKDLTTGDVGAGWLNTYVSATVAIELAPRAAKGAEDRAILRMAADPGKLTADGRSSSRVKVWLTDLSGSPIVNAKVAFALGNENGRLRILRGTTDAKGVAEADYRAGTAVGTVTVTASAAQYGVTAAVQIVLLADAPAKIDLVASAAALIANGSDTATLSVRVSDIHENPNANVPVTFAVLQGSGKVSAPAIVTGRNGEGTAAFEAGTTAGTVVIEARHTSRAPTGDELRRVYGTVFVPRWYERQERDRMMLGEWRVKPGDEVEKGQVLVTLDTRAGGRDLVAPAGGVFVREVKHERDRVELGDTLGYVEIDPEVWKMEYAK